MTRRNSLIILMVILVSLSATCAKKTFLSWETIPENKKAVTFDEEKGLLSIEKSGISLSFTPPPHIEKVGENYEGTITIANNGTKDIVVMWEMVDLIDSYGFFKTFKFGQIVRLSFSFPTTDEVIPSGNIEVFPFSLNSSDFDNLSELKEYARFTLILPIKITESIDPTIFEVGYTVREIK